MKGLNQRHTHTMLFFYCCVMSLKICICWCAHTTLLLYCITRRLIILSWSKQGNISSFPIVWNMIVDVTEEIYIHIKHTHWDAKPFIISIHIQQTRYWNNTDIEEVARVHLLLNTVLNRANSNAEPNKIPKVIHIALMLIQSSLLVAYLSFVLNR